MTSLPTPDARDRVADPTPRRAPGRHLAVGCIIAGVLGVGGLAGAQIAGATAPDGAIDEAAPAGSSPQSDPVEVDITDLGTEFAAQFEAYDACMAEQLPGLFDDEATSNVEMIEIGPDGFDADDISDFAEWELPDSVTIHTGGEDGTFTMLDLGDGDSTITITKTDGEVVVSSNGDVEEIDLGPIDVETDEAWAAEIEQFDDAHEECDDLLPESVELLTDVGFPAEAVQAES